MVLCIRGTINLVLHSYTLTTSKFKILNRSSKLNDLIILNYIYLGNI